MFQILISVEKDYYHTDFRYLIRVQNRLPLSFVSVVVTMVSPGKTSKGKYTPSFRSVLKAGVKKTKKKKEATVGKC